MKGNPRLRRLALPYALAVLALALAACSGKYPNTTFDPHSEFGRDIDFLWDRLLLIGTIVFVLVESALIFVIFKYRRRPNDARPPQTHGNAVLEVVWTLIPAVILLFIAVPTVRTIFRTQAKVAAGALEIEVIGHQWWWEFRYPQYNFTTANEIYIPTGRTVNFKLTSMDVIHSFWIPQLGGKRDAITNRVNYLWMTPDSAMQPAVWNGFCTEFCGDSHAKMRFRVFTVRPPEFASWVASQQTPAAFGAVAAPRSAGQPGGTPGSATTGQVTAGQQAAATQVATGQATNPNPATVTGRSTGPSNTANETATATTAQAVQSKIAQNPLEPRISGTGAQGGNDAAIRRAPGSRISGPDTMTARAPISAIPVSNIAPGYKFPKNQPAFAYARPRTPLPTGLNFTKGLTGNAARGQKVYSTAACIGCHAIQGNPMSVGNVGPNLTHFGSRSTIAAGNYPNTPAYLALWLKNAPRMKPGVLMPTLGKNEISPQTGKPVTMGGLDDQQIADIVAYLTALK